MRKSVIALMSGVAIGVYLGYKNEDNIEDMAHMSKKYKKQLKKKMNHLSCNL